MSGSAGTTDHAGAAESEPERLVTGYSGRLLLAVSLGWTSIQGGRLLLSPLLPAISTDLGLSSTRAGVAITVVWGLYALLQYPSGRLSDRLSRTTLLVGGLCLACVGFLALAAATTYPALLAGAAVVGLGAGLYPTPARGLVSDLFVERRGQAFGIHTASGDLGGVVAAGLATLVLAVATWRAGFPLVVAVLAGVALALHVWSREGYVLERVGLAVGETGRRLFAEPRLRWLLVAYSLYAFSWQSAVSFLPTYLQAGKSFSPALANAGFGALFVVGAVVKPLAGAVGDRFRRDLVAPAALALAAVALAGVVVASTPALVVVGVACFAAGLMAYPPVMQAYLMDSFPTDSMGGDLGAMRTFYIGLGALGPTYVGAVADAFDYRVAFAGLVGCLFVSTGLVLVGGRAGRRAA
ncbi:MFS transporter [Candidatus Halobonum tyrrellensis]|uniref:Major facilitator superfamily protein n=1 Tax=Candidatus Halobonum tyrrellensis G22 TaxID=1324957 RepID=V4IWA9_9EURY|nr:MFS transporter [Candidatus Halobonum tyrrellensis]ESP87467.1 major facilitator superfamily protein [Candidatus Halobonum tyrrellensis G22]